jgi:hypothetical protein
MKQIMSGDSVPLIPDLRREILKLNSIRQKAIRIKEIIRLSSLLKAGK